jgi:hypothetical protein
MARILTSSLTPGMMLSRPLLNKNGVMVLSDGTELTEALIKKIRKMGIDEADVQGTTAAFSGGRTEALAQLDARFKNAETAPHMDVLKQLVREHLEGLCGNDGSESAEE